MTERELIGQQQMEIANLREVLTVEHGNFLKTLEMLAMLKADTLSLDDLTLRPDGWDVVAPAHKNGMADGPVAAK